MSTSSQTDWAAEKADEILRRLDHRDVAYDTELIAAALRAERERCAQIAEAWGRAADPFILKRPDDEYMKAMRETAAHIAAGILEGA